MRQNVELYRKGFKATRGERRERGNINGKMDLKGWSSRGELSDFRGNNSRN